MKQHWLYNKKWYLMLHRYEVDEFSVIEENRGRFDKNSYYEISQILRLVHQNTSSSQISKKTSVVNKEM